MNNEILNKNIWLTISIGVYNGEKYISECLDSIIDKRVDFGYEIIITNDGSTDDTLRIISEYKDKAPDIIRLYSKENQGQGSTYNIGIQEAKGKYIMFADGDDLLDMEELEKIHKNVGEKEYDILFHDNVSIKSENSIELIAISVKEEHVCKVCEQPLSEGEFNFVDIWDKCNRLIHNNIFFVDFLRSNSITADETYKYGADAILEVRAAAYAEKVFCIHNRPYIYRISENQITGTKKLNRMLEDRILLLSSAVDCYDNMIGTCEQTDKRYEIIKTCICNISGLAYMAAIYSNDIHHNISIINKILKSKKDIWKVANIKIKIISCNIFALYPIMKMLIWARYKKIKA